VRKRLEATHSLGFLDLPSLSANELGEIRRTADELEASLAGCREGQALDVLAMLAAALPPRRDMGDRQWAMLEAQYAEVLAGYPAWALDDARRKCLRRCRFFPSAAEICQAAEETTGDARALLHAAKRLIFRADA